MLDIILITIAFAVLIAGSITDFKIREVADWVNYSAIAAGIGIRLIYSAYTLDWSVILSGVYGFAIFLAIALALFYLGQWGGGDSKMLMGLGALIGFEFRPDHLLIGFFINMLFVGAFFGVAWSIYLSVRHRKRFLKYANKIVQTDDYKKTRKIVFMIAIVFGFASFFMNIYVASALLTTAFVLLVVFYSWIFLKAVENTCLVKNVDVEVLTEGDWIVNDVKVDGKRICGPKDLGISKAQISTLMKFKRRGKIQKVLIKIGMPFIPVFLIAFFIAVMWGNVVLWFI